MGDSVVVKVTLQADPNDALAIKREWERNFRNIQASYKFPDAAKFSSSINTAGKTPTATYRFDTRPVQKAKNDVDALNGSMKNSIAGINTYSDAVNKASNATAGFAEKTGFTAARLSAYLLPAGIVFKLAAGLAQARDAVVEINADLNKLTQIMGRGASASGDVADAVFRAAKEFGVSGKELLKTTNILAQAGDKFAGDNLLKTVNALAKTPLLATFGSMEDTTQGLIAAFGQFNKEGKDTVEFLDVANELAKGFAVESADIFEAVKAGGKAFNIAGSDFKQFAATVTAAKQLTGLSASTIGTGLNTIALRVLRRDNIVFLDQFTGGKIRDAKGNLKELTSILIETGKVFNKLDRESQIAVGEKLFGTREGKLGIPLLSDAGSDKSVLRAALQSSQSAVGSVDRDVKTAENRIDISLQKISTNFEEVFLKISKDKGIENFFKSLVSVSEDFTSVLKKLSPLLSSTLKLGGGFLAGKALASIPSFLSGAEKYLRSSKKDDLTIAQRLKIRREPIVSSAKRSRAGSGTSGPDEDIADAPYSTVGSMLDPRIPEPNAPAKLTIQQRREDLEKRRLSFFEDRQKRSEYESKLYDARRRQARIAASASDALSNLSGLPEHVIRKTKDQRIAIAFNDASQQVNIPAALAQFKSEVVDKYKLPNKEVRELDRQASERILQRRIAELLATDREGKVAGRDLMQKYLPPPSVRKLSDYDKAARLVAEQEQATLTGPFNLSTIHREANPAIEAKTRGRKGQLVSAKKKALQAEIITRTNQNIAFSEIQEKLEIRELERLRKRAKEAVEGTSSALAAANANVATARNALDSIGSLASGASFRKEEDLINADLAPEFDSYQRQNRSTSLRKRTRKFAGILDLAGIDRKKSFGKSILRGLALFGSETGRSVTFGQDKNAEDEFFSSLVDQGLSKKEIQERFAAERHRFASPIVPGGLSKKQIGKYFSKKIDESSDSAKKGASKAARSIPTAAMVAAPIILDQLGQSASAKNEDLFDYNGNLRSDFSSRASTNARTRTLGDALSGAAVGASIGASTGLPQVVIATALIGGLVGAINGLGDASRDTADAILTSIKSINFASRDASESPKQKIDRIKANIDPKISYLFDQPHSNSELEELQKRLVVGSEEQRSAVKAAQIIFGNKALQDVGGTITKENEAQFHQALFARLREAYPQNGSKQGLNLLRLAGGNSGVTGERELIDSYNQSNQTTLELSANTRQLDDALESLMGTMGFLQKTSREFDMALSSGRSSLNVIKNVHSTLTGGPSSGFGETFGEEIKSRFNNAVVNGDKESINKLTGGFINDKTKSSLFSYLDTISALRDAAPQLESLATKFKQNPDTSIDKSAMLSEFESAINGVEQKYGPSEVTKAIRLKGKSIISDSPASLSGLTPDDMVKKLTEGLDVPKAVLEQLTQKFSLLDQRSQDLVDRFSLQKVVMGQFNDAINKSVVASSAFIERGRSLGDNNQAVAASIRSQLANNGTVDIAGRANTLNSLALQKNKLDAEIESLKINDPEGRRISVQGERDKINVAFIQAQDAYSSELQKLNRAVSITSQLFSALSETINETKTKLSTIGSSSRPEFAQSVRGINSLEFTGIRAALSGKTLEGSIRTLGTNGITDVLQKVSGLSEAQFERYVKSLRGVGEDKIAEQVIQLRGISRLNSSALPADLKSASGLQKLLSDVQQVDSLSKQLFDLQKMEFDATRDIAETNRIIANAVTGQSNKDLGLAPLPKLSTIEVKPPVPAAPVPEQKESEARSISPEELKIMARSFASAVKNSFEGEDGSGLQTAVDNMKALHDAVQKTGIEMTTNLKGVISFEGLDKVKNEAQAEMAIVGLIDTMISVMNVSDPAQADFIANLKRAKTMLQKKADKSKKEAK